MRKKTVRGLLAALLPKGSDRGLVGLSGEHVDPPELTQWPIASGETRKMRDGLATEGREMRGPDAQSLSEQGCQDLL